MLDPGKVYLNPRMNKTERIASPVNSLTKEPTLKEQPGDLQKIMVEPSKSNPGRGMTLRNTVSSSAEETSGAVVVPVFQIKGLILLIGLLTLVGVRGLRG